MGTGIGMWLFWIVGIVAVLMIAKVLLVGSFGQTSSSFDGPLNILQKRYAWGEIGKDEFERMKKELEK